MNVLRERWTEEMLGRLTPLFDRAAKHQQIRNLDLDPETCFGTFDEFVDLRGYPLHKLTSYKAQRLDFSHSRSPTNPYGQDSLAFITACILENCRFVDVSLFHRCAGSFRSCDFRASKFVGGSLVGQFKDCIFDDANLSKAVLGDTFTRCSFRNVNLRRATMTMCRFENCIFENCNLKDAWFGEDLNQLPTETMTVFAPLAGPIKYDKTGT